MLKDRDTPADTTYVMLVVVALMLWFVLSVPATLVLGRVLTNLRRGAAVPAPVGRLVMSREDLSRR